MIKTRHCDLCDNSKRSLKIGMTCGLTNKKPDFEVTCPDIKFSDSFKESLTELQNQIRQLKKRKTSVFLNFCLFGTIGAIIIIGSFPHLITNFKQTFEPEISFLNWEYFTLILALNFVGFLLISMGSWPLKKNSKELKKLESQRKEIELVLNNYGIETESLLQKTTPQHRV